MFPFPIHIVDDEDAMVGNRNTKGMSSLQKEKHVFKRCKELVSMYRDIDPDKARTIACLDQHDPVTGKATPGWLAARIGRITGSMSGSVARSHMGASKVLNPYESPTKALRTMLGMNPFKGNDATRWGNHHEDMAEEAFLLGETACGRWDFPRGVQHRGLVVCEEPGMGMFGMSPDGVADEVGGAAQASGERVLVEYKCPYRQRQKTAEIAMLMVEGETSNQYEFMDVDWLDAAVRGDKGDALRVPATSATAWITADLYPENHLPDGTIGPVPPYYWCQVQYGMTVLGLRRAFFCVWAPMFANADRVVRNRPACATTGMLESRVCLTFRGLCQTTVVPRAEQWCDTVLMPQLHEFWYGRYVPYRAMMDLGIKTIDDLSRGRLPRDAEEIANKWYRNNTLLLA